MSCDYVHACSLIPLIHYLRETVLEGIVKGSRLPVKDFYKTLLFSSKEGLENYFLKNGLVVDIRFSKSTKEEIYYFKEGALAK